MKLRKIILGVFASMTIINLFGCTNEFEKNIKEMLIIVLN